MELCYSYDGSWYGLLTVIFEAFNRKETPSVIIKVGENGRSLFLENRTIITDIGRAKRVEKGLKKTSLLTYKRVFNAFLSEKKNIELMCLEICRLVFKDKSKAESDFRNFSVLKLKQIEKEVSREVHRMHAFVRFQKSIDENWYAFIQPDFNVMPLIGNHFERRYADQKWIIYDLKRKYGLHYDLEKTSFISIDFQNKVKGGKLPKSAMAKEELQYQGLWQEYFNSVNIKERRNMKLHIQHVPLRYWGLLTEKFVR